MRNVPSVVIGIMMTGCLFGVAVAAEQSASQGDIERQEISVTDEEKKDSSVHNFPLASEIAGTNLEKQRNAYLKTHHLRMGFDKKGSYIGWGEASIETLPESIDFGQKRIGTFEKAFADAKGGFVRTKKQQVTVRVIRKFFHDDKSNKDYELKDGTSENIKKKIFALTEAKLDQMLRELDVDPKSLENSDIYQKRTLVEDSLNKTITVTALHAIPGVRILATFEDVKGVGVLIKQNQKTASLAKAIASQNLVGYPSAIDPVDAINGQLDTVFSNDTDYISQYGVRIMVDEYGNRVLVSFGQWSPKVTRSDTKMTINMAVKAAKQIAYEQAISYMTQFVRTTLALDVNTKIKDNNVTNQLVHTDNRIEKISNSSVAALVNQYIDENSTATIEGVAEVKTWAVNHPETGHLIVGKVLMWSPATQEYARQKNRTNTSSVDDDRANNSKKSHKIFQSKDVGDEDF